MRYGANNLAEIDLATFRPGRVPALVRQIAFGLFCTGMFILLRTIVDQVAPTAGPFALIYPTVLTATLFGRWQAGLVAYVSALVWTWFFLLPRAALLHLAKPGDLPRVIVNASTILFVLVFAEVFRRAIRRASAQRDAALRETAAREAELRELNQTLEARVEERSTQLLQAEEALRQAQKLEAIGQLTGGVAHDFNNLLTVIKGSVELLKRSSLPEGKHHRYIDAIGDTADRAAKLTSHLLSFARRQALKPEIFELRQSADEIANLVRSLLGSRIALDIQVPPEPVFVRADRSQFDTAIVNLAVNARDAMAGEGRLIIGVGCVSGIPAIRAHAPVPGDFVAVSVTDTGEGIGGDRLDHIFEPFFTTKRVGEGTGLGLSQVIGFAKQSDGDVRVESRVGRGSTFTLYLPRVHPAAGQVADRAIAERNVDGDGLCILVVEDNPAVAEFAAAALRELNYDSVSVPDAAEALARLERAADRFHAVFSDVVMPGMSGLELGATIRRLYPDLPVILASGYSDVLARNGEHGFELLHKPYSVEQLSRVLRRAVAGRTVEGMP